MRIDAYTHFIPPKFFERLVESGAVDIGKRMRGVPAIHDLDLRRKIVDMFPDYAQILSYPMPPLEVVTPDPAKIADYAKVVNDGFAAICAAHPAQRRCGLLAVGAARPQSKPAAGPRRRWTAVARRC